MANEEMKGMKSILNELMLDLVKSMYKDILKRETDGTLERLDEETKASHELSKELCEGMIKYSEASIVMDGLKDKIDRFNRKYPSADEKKSQLHDLLNSFGKN